MPNVQIPLIYHPTNVLMLDDDRGFLNDVSYMIDTKIPVVLETDSHKALNYLASHTYQSERLSAIISKQTFELDDLLNTPSPGETFSINFSHLCNSLDSSDRFKVISVAFVDKMMPSMDG